MGCVVCFAEVDESTAVRKSPICPCRLCKDCFIKHCTHLARNAYVSDFTCPGCSLPDVFANPDEVQEYFNYLYLQIKAVHLDPPLIKLMEKKILDWQLRQLTDYYKCAHCELGFKHESRESPSMTCTLCRNLTCYYCKHKYEADHECIEDDNCDAIPTIECPRCHQVYEHVASDCLHSVCLEKECLHEFCSGCKQPYYKPLEATDSQEKHGYQCDHSRNCLSKLNSYEVDELLGLLEENKIRIDSDVMAQSGKCTFTIHVDGYRGSRACGQPSGERGYCKKHYKDHLIRQINAAGIDPVTALTIEAMKEELRSKEKELPQLTGDEVEDTLILRAAVKELPLTEITEQSIEITCEPVDLIECSKCGVKYEIARGACIHFTCPNCKHQFCGTCLVPFIRDPVRGLTCKHTRNCLASLRDYEIDELLNLAQENKAELHLEVKGKTCILKITDDSYKEMECGNDCHENYAYCLQHFKEYVINQLNSNDIDPINILDDQALKMELFNCGIEAAVAVGMSRAQMVKIIKEKVPLKKMAKPKLKVTPKNLKKIASVIQSAQQKDREKAEKNLELMITTRTTVCPQCKSKHEDMWNGSLRYTCYLCDIEYCSFCLKLFTGMQSGCSQNCARLGNHCHHPKNCFYYLQDYEVEDLQKSLEDHNVPLPSTERKAAVKACRTVIELDIMDHTKAILCKKRTFVGEICLEHYKESLARLIYKHGIIPVLSEAPPMALPDHAEQMLRTALTFEHLNAALHDLSFTVPTETPRKLPAQSNQHLNQIERLTKTATPFETYAEERAGSVADPFQPRNSTSDAERSEAVMWSRYFYLDK